MISFEQHKPFVIAGPCGAESHEQMIEIGERLSTSSVHMIRAGIWKPRSKPGHFEGRGEEAIPWLMEAGRISGKPVCTEVANTSQVEAVLKHQVHAVWIGARSTVNPFLVQELAESMKGSNLSIMIKNPVNPDIELWSGAVERFRKLGFKEVVAIHRGFSNYDPAPKYRNRPMWALPIELKRRYADLPVICDVSHICGSRDLLMPVAQRALDLDFDGLMIETHPHPEQALSDSQQQVTPEVLISLLSQLMVRKTDEQNAPQEIDSIRTILDSLDAEVVDLLGKRMEWVRKLGHIKNAHQIPVYQVERWREIIETRTAWGEKNQLSKDFIFKLFEWIHDTSINTQLDLDHREE